MPVNRATRAGGRWGGPPWDHRTPSPLHPQLRGRSSEDLVAQVGPRPRRRRVVKLGDWIDREVGDLAPCWPVDVLTEAIAAAHEEGARVTAHCFEEESLHDFAEAGTDRIEHATGLTEATIATLRRSRSASCRRSSTSTPFLDSPPAPGVSRMPHMLDPHARRHATIAAHSRGRHTDLRRHGRWGHRATAWWVDDASNCSPAASAMPRRLTPASWAAWRWPGARR